MATDLARLPATCAGCGSKVELHKLQWVDRGTDLEHFCIRVDKNACSAYDEEGPRAAQTAGDRALILDERTREVNRTARVNGGANP